MKKAIEALLERLIPEKLRTRLGATFESLSCLRFRYRCPFCNSRLESFLPFGFTFPVLQEQRVVGGGYRENALCPTCGSLDRERLLYLYLLHKTDIFDKPTRLLHVAPEAKLADILRTKANIDYLTADNYAEDVMVKLDITDIGFPDDSFDAILCNHVLEHIINDRKAMSELYRTLKPGGWAILQVPISLTLKNTYEDFSIRTEKAREDAFGQKDHVRIYGEDYRDRLAQAGFQVNVFKWVAEAKNFGDRRNVFGLNKEESVYFVSKHR